MLIASKRVAGKKTPYPKVVKNFGTVATEEDALKLKATAQQYLELTLTKDNQAELKNITPLVINFGKDISSCTTEIIGFKHIYEQLFNSIFPNTGLKKVGNAILKKLAIMRIIKLKSKRYTANMANNFGYYI